MRVRYAEHGYAVVFLNICAAPALAALSLQPVEVDRLTFDEAVFRERNHYVFFRDEIFCSCLVNIIKNDCASLVRETRGQVLKFCAYDVVEGLFVA